MMDITEPNNRPPADSIAALSEPSEADARSDSVLVRVLEFNEGRKRRRVRLKLKRMAASPFAFFRGADHLYADAWKDLRPNDPGPDLPICGDLHLENFGAYRDDNGEVCYDINDFDEAVVAPCSLDLVRCATSILLASELWKLTPLDASGMVLEFLDTYRSTLASSSDRKAVDPRAPRLARGPIWEILGKSVVTDQAVLLDRYTEIGKTGKRRILREKDRHPAIKMARAEKVQKAVEAYAERLGRADFFEVLDVTDRIAGIGSLGVSRYTVLVAGGGSSETNRLFDLKACLPSALASCSTHPWPFDDASDADRVVHAQKMLQAEPTAGLDVLPVDETAYRVREMIPEENRSSLSRFHKKPETLGMAVGAAGLLTALSHQRGANAYPEGGGVESLERWAAGPAFDSVFAAGARFAERMRVAHRQFCAERKSPEALPARLRRRFCR